MEKKQLYSMRFVRIMLSLLLILTILPIAAFTPARTAQAAGYPAQIVNGSFSYPSGILSSSYNYCYINPATGQYAKNSETTAHSVSNFNSATFGWKSTETNSLGAGVQVAWPYKVELQMDVSGNQYAEIVASQHNTSIYQDIATTPGAVYKWSLKHASLSSEHLDIMQVRIGTPSNQSAQNATRTTVNGHGDAKGSVGTNIATKVTNAETEDRNHSGQWETYTGSYFVPAGQTVTRFAFKSVSGEDDLDGSGLPRTLGNLVDDISFQISYPLKYNLTGGSSNSIYSDPTANNYAGYHTANKSVALTSAKPTRSGYVFLGWSASQVADVTSYSAYQSAKSKLITNVTMASPGKTVYAVWGKNPTVTFKPGYGANTALKTQTVTFGAGASAPTISSRTGYTFTSWDKDYDEVYGDLTVTAQWNAHRYSILFDANTGRGTMENQTMIYDKAENLYENLFAKPGYHFIQWNLNADGSGGNYTDQQQVSNLTATDGGSVTMFAQWEENDPVRISYLTNDPAHASLSRASEDVRPATGTASGSEASPARGYHFVAWQDEGGNVVSTDAAFTPARNADQIYEEAAYTAFVEPNQYIVHYDANGGNGIMDDHSMTYDKADRLHKNAFTRDGYMFLGWNTAADGTGSGYTDQREVMNLVYEHGQEITLYAQWESNPYAIAFDANSGSGEMDDQQMAYGRLSPLKQNLFTRDGYVFTHWNTQPDGSGASYADEQEVLNLVSARGEKVTLYAQWKVNTYSVCFDANTGEGHMDDQQMVYDKTDALHENTFTKPGYVFAGWNTHVDGRGTAYTDKQEVSNLVSVQEGSLRLYAQWKPASYAIAFNANAGAGTMENQAMTYDKADALHENVFIRSGYIFMGWNTAADGSGAAYQDKQQVLNLTEADGSVITLYAVWQAHPYTIAFDANGGDGTMENQLMLYDKADALHENAFSRPGYAFLGWSDTPGGDVIYTDMQEVSNLTEKLGGFVPLYAVWQEYPAVHIAYRSDDPAHTSLSRDEETPAPATGSVSGCSLALSEGYRIVCWKDQADAIVSSNATLLPVKGADGLWHDAVYTAYTEPISYAIAFDANTGEGHMDDQQMVYDKSENLRENAFTKEGYTFRGWNTKPDGKGVWYMDKKEVSNLTTENGGKIVLYAQWEAIPYTVSFVDGQGNILSEQKVPFGAGAKAPDEPEKRGYAFAGWDTDYSHVTQDLVVTALWEPLPKPDEAEPAKASEKKTEQVKEGSLFAKTGDFSGFAFALMAASLLGFAGYGGYQRRKEKKR